MTAAAEQWRTLARTLGVYDENAETAPTWDRLLDMVRERERVRDAIQHDANVALEQRRTAERRLAELEEWIDNATTNIGYAREQLTTMHLELGYALGRLRGAS